MKMSFWIYNVLYALLTLGIYNLPFWREFYPTVSVPVAIAVGCCLFFALLIVQGLIFYSKTVKILSILLIFSNALASYFIGTYHLVLNKTMLANVFDTNFFEATEWMGRSFWIYIGLAGFVPALCVLFIRIHFGLMRKRLLFILVCVMMLLGIGSTFIPHKTAVKVYLKENFNLRYMFVPTSYISSLVSLVQMQFKNVPHVDSMAGMVQKKYWIGDKKNLIVFVLGESARDANFSLSGYKRKTAEPLVPYLKDMTVFHKTESCGVVTRVALPCMFSFYNRSNYSERAANYAANALDILAKSGMNMLWLDNEMGCNKVCRNIQTEFTCHSRDCTDEVLNEKLREYLPTITTDSFVVLHQRGSHGPRYDLRVPKVYHQWKPVCVDEDSKNCSYGLLVNAYDNSIYYTSLVIADAIKMLSTITDKYNPVLIYISDHGDSLGEGGFYGHGGDFKDAPDVQKQVPFFIWMPESTRKAFGIDKRCLDEATKKQQSQDVIFHSLLGLLGIQTAVYQKELDLFAGCHP